MWSSLFYDVERAGRTSDSFLQLVTWSFRAGECGRLTPLISLRQSPRTRRDGRDSPAVRADPRRARRKRLCVRPGLRSVQRHRPLSIIAGKKADSTERDCLEANFNPARKTSNTSK